MILAGEGRTRRVRSIYSRQYTGRRPLKDLEVTVLSMLESGGVQRVLEGRLEVKKGRTERRVPERVSRRERREEVDNNKWEVERGGGEHEKEREKKERRERGDEP